MPSSFARYIASWLDTMLDGKSPATLQSYRSAARTLCDFLESQFPEVRDFKDVRPLHLRALLAYVRASGVSQNTVAHLDRTLRAIFARIAREGREDFDLPAGWVSPFGVVEKERPQRVPKIPLSELQAKALLATAPRNGFLAYRNYAELAFMLMTGARSIEVRNLRLENLDLDHRLADLRVTKGGKPRFVHLPTKLVRILSNYLQRRDPAVGSLTDLVFPTRDGKIQTRRAFHRSVVSAGKRIGIDSLGPHKLRHSYVTLSHAQGAPIKFLQEQCGHSSILVTQGYISLAPTQKAELADRYSCL